MVPGGLARFTLLGYSAAVMTRVSHQHGHHHPTSHRGIGRDRMA